MRMFESKATFAVFVVTVGILLANAGLSGWNTLRLVNNNRWVAHTQKVIETFEEIQATVADAETGQRGYLITGDPRYLKTYETATERIEPQLRDLEKLTADNPQQRVHVATLTELVHDRLERLQHNVSVRQAEGFEAAQQIVGTDQGQLLMEKIQETVEAIQAAENKLLDVRAAESDRSWQVKIATNVVGTLLGIGAVCVAFFLFQRTLAERRRTENTLRESEQRFRALADSVPEIVWTSLPDGRCDYVNRRWFDFTGMTAEETLGFGWVAAVHEEDAQRSSDRWMRSMETGEPFECEYRFRRKDGTYRWCLGRALPMRDLHGRVVKWFGNCMDIDEHKRMEEMLVDADHRKDQFLAMLGHELRNPLTPICSAVELLRMKSPDDPEIQWAADTIVRQTDQIIRLVNDLLDISRIIHGKIRLERELVDLRTIAARAVETCQPLTESKDQELTASLPDEPIWVHADTSRLLQVIDNLLTNAVRYSEKGGQIRLSAASEGTQAVVRVRDDGIGIAPDMLPRVFDLFAQAEHPVVRSQGGLGLGLRLVANLVEMHGGSVEVFSDGPGTGSEFVVHLPAATEPRPPLAPQQPQGDAARLATSQRVLIVDDHARILYSLARVLKRKGHEVRTAANAEGALAETLDFQPSVVLADVGLPGIDGFELAARLRRQDVTENALLIALTGFADEDVRNRALKVGFDHLLVKPPVFAELETLLQSAHRPPLAGAISDSS